MSLILDTNNHCNDTVCYHCCLDNHILLLQILNLIAQTANAGVMGAGGFAAVPISVRFETSPDESSQNGIPPDWAAMQQAATMAGQHEFLTQMQQMHQV